MDKKITFRLTENSYNILKHICNVKKISMTELIRKALISYIWDKDDNITTYDGET